MLIFCWDKTSCSNLQVLLRRRCMLESRLPVRHQAAGAPLPTAAAEPAAGALAWVPAPPRGAERYCTPPAAPNFSSGFAKGRSKKPLFSQARFRFFLNTNPATPGTYWRLQAAVCLCSATAREFRAWAPAQGEPSSCWQCRESWQRAQARGSRKQLRTWSHDRGQNLGYELIRLSEIWCKSGFVGYIYI